MVLAYGASPPNSIADLLAEMPPMPQASVFSFISNRHDALNAAIFETHGPIQHGSAYPTKLHAHYTMDPPHLCCLYNAVYAPNADTVEVSIVPLQAPLPTPSTHYTR